MNLKNFSYKYKIIALALIIITLLSLSIILTISNTVNDILKSIIFENQSNAIKRNTELISHW